MKKTLFTLGIVVGLIGASFLLVRAGVSNPATSLSVTNLLGYEDQFGKLIADNTTNELDIPSHYPQSPERLRVFVDGTRQLLQYGSVSQYNHTTSTHELTPSAGETVIMETTERPRYVVQYESLVSWAFGLNQSLQTGDQLRVGYYDDMDGWYLEHNPSHADDEVDLVIRKEGSAIKTRAVTLAKPVTDFTRYELQYNWYNVGAGIWRQTYSENNEQKNVKLGSISIDDGTQGPSRANLPLRFEITAGGSTSNLKLNAGSMAAVTLGNAVGITREKTGYFETTGTTIDTADVWIPIHAIRVAPDKEIVDVQMTGFNVAEFSGSGDVQLMALAVNSSKTDASNFGIDTLLNGRNSALEVATSSNVSTMPDSDGNVVASTTNPGGYQIAYAALWTDTTGSVKGQTASERTRKREIGNDDIILIVARASVTGDVKVEFTFEEEW